MKKLLFVLLLVLMPAAAFAAETPDRDILLTPTGTLYTVEGEWAAHHPEVATASTRYLVLTTRTGDTVTRTLVPDSSVTAGVHTNPALAYDRVSETLFVFWKHSSNGRVSNLMVASMTADGRWSDAKAFSNVSSVWRSNLRIGLTRKSFFRDSENNEYAFPEINIHVAWWEDRGGDEELARYAMLTIENGAISNTAEYDLEQFADFAKPATDRNDDDEEAMNTEILRHPAIFESADHATVDIVFGDTKEKNFNRVTLRPFKPYVESRVRIPLGVKGQTFGAPRFRTEASDSQIGAIGGSGDNMVLFFKTAAAVKYLAYLGEKSGWSDIRSIPIDATGNADAAIEALRRMVTSE
ncbi:MAG TPA: hypothetical protein VF618_14430 [Thermoanaerobaculia bacterium]